jgi:hypothetical protein
MPPLGVVAGTFSSSLDTIRDNLVTTSLIAGNHASTNSNDVFGPITPL